MDSDQIQLEALKLAVELYEADPMRPGGDPEDAVLKTASKFARWLGNPVLSLSIKAAVWTYDQQSNRHTPTVFKGDIVELKDNQQVSLTVEAKDAKGFDTNEAGDIVLTWDTSDNNVVSLQPAADGLSCLAVAGSPGSALVTVSDGTNSGSLAVDVTAGPAVSLQVNAGTPEDQPAPPAP